MVITNVTGGFANQLFRFSAGYRFCVKFREEIILQVYDKEYYVDAYLLDELNIQCYKKIITKTRGDISKLASVFKKNSYLLINEENYFSLLEENELDKNTLYYIDAPFQKTKYFMPIVPQLRNMFSFKNISDHYIEVEKLIKKSNSVGIHIRRRDFIDMKNIMDAGGETYLTGYRNDFYLAAIVYIRKQIKEPTFFVFSDDIEFCKNYLGESRDINFVKMIGGKFADIEEFFLLSQCTHKILTRGSSFGRMADVLNENEDGITIYYGADKYNEKEKIVYLGDEFIDTNSKKFYTEMQSVDSTNNLAFEKQWKCEKDYYDSANLFYISEHYDLAEQTLLRGWQYSHTNKDFLLLYANTLIKNNKIYDAYIMAMAYVHCGGNLDEVKYLLNDTGIIEALINLKDFGVLIVPQEPFKNAEYNDLCNIGILMTRMGLDVNYIFNEASKSDSANMCMHNEILKNNYMYTNCEGYKYNSRMYDRYIIEKQYSINQFIEKLIYHQSFILITDDPYVIKKCGCLNLYKVYWDALITQRNYKRNSDDVDLDMVDFYVSDERNKNPDFFIERKEWQVEINEKIGLNNQYVYSNYIYRFLVKLGKMIIPSHKRV